MANRHYTECAPAKINLTLRIRGRRPDGYHELESLVAFAIDASDQLELASRLGLTLSVDGPEATALDGENLVVRVARALGDFRPELIMGAFHLTKRLPVASGIGGGSADAAAALRLIAAANAIADPETAFAGFAAPFGADIPVCVGGGGGQAAFMSGIGEKVWRPEGADLLPAGGVAAVLVNPRVAVATVMVFKALGAGLIADDGAGTPAPPGPFENMEALLAYLGDHGNDLEAPARRIAPVITEVLDTLSGQPEARLVRMSGSGATCYALFDDVKTARACAANLRSRHPQWWVAPTRLC